jgi:predicted branched-subunit amino acid permease
MRISTRFTEFLAGLRAELPILIGVAPFGMIYGILALQAGLNRAEAQSMSAIVFAGSSQIVITQLLHEAVPGIVIILTVAVVNLRHALYSASLAPYLQHLNTPWKLLLGYLLTDEAYAVTVIHYEQNETAALAEWTAPDERGEPGGNVLQRGIARTVQGTDYRHFFYLGAGLALWATWQISTAAGIFLGAVIPESWGLDFTLVLTFIALVVPNLRDRAGVLAALAAGFTAMLAFSMPFKLGLMTAALVGIIVGLMVEEWGKKP